jgi:hypothetical protein
MSLGRYARLDQLAGRSSLLAKAGFFPARTAIFSWMETPYCMVESVAAGNAMCCARLGILAPPPPAEGIASVSGEARIGCDMRLLCDKECRGRSNAKNMITQRVLGLKADRNSSAWFENRNGPPRLESRAFEKTERWACASAQALACALNSKKN